MSPNHDLIIPVLRYYPGQRSTPDNPFFQYTSIHDFTAIHSIDTQGLWETLVEFPSEFDK